MIRILVLSAMVSFGSGLSAAPVPKELRKSDLERMQGVWVIAVDSKVKARDIRWDFRGEKLYVDGSGAKDDPGMEFSVVLDPQSSPARIDISRKGDRRCRGIYRFDGEQLQLSYILNSPRPKDFESPQKWIMTRPTEAKK